ncbi:hypothetical protein [Leptolyngbya sp. 'hensonii']|uniref:hypothetical protein n=1 Tax=Leptolyngbya sp. 'hensonii' TaxID=1922337 RepID=UPI000B1A739E|nr:hypothetical protein [Leptolyngbya sp. 'hensonii']
MSSNVELQSAIVLFQKATFRVQRTIVSLQKTTFRVQSATFQVQNTIVLSQTHPGPAIGLVGNPVHRCSSIGQLAKHFPDRCDRLLGTPLLGGAARRAGVGR